MTGVLSPLDRKSLLYHALRAIHRTFESIWGRLRTRYGIFGKQKAAARRKPGVHEQRFLAQVALVIEWLRICLRHGYICSQPSRNQNEPRDDTHAGQARSTQRLAPGRYGPAAVAQGFALPPPDG